jgi:hypothetical protein
MKKYELIHALAPFDDDIEIVVQCLDTVFPVYPDARHATLNDYGVLVLEIPTHEYGENPDG